MNVAEDSAAYKTTQVIIERAPPVKSIELQLVRCESVLPAMVKEGEYLTCMRYTVSLSVCVTACVYFCLSVCLSVCPLTHFPTSHGNPMHSSRRRGCL